MSENQLDTSDAPYLTAVNYDGQTLSAWWTAVPGLSSYDFNVIKDQVIFQSSSVDSAQIALDLGSLPADSAYAVTVCAGSACSQEMPLIISPLEGLQVALTNLGVSVRWQPINGVTTYGVGIYEDGSLLQEVLCYALSQDLYFPPAVQQPTRYNVEVWGLTGDSGDNVWSSGPRSAASITLYPAPVLEFVSWDGKDGLTARWTATTGVSTPTYIFQARHQGNEYQTWSLTATEKRFKVKLPPPHSYSVWVREKNTAWSQEVPVVFSVPDLAIGTDGNQVLARWGQAGVSYAAELASNDLWGGQQQTTDRFIVFPGQLQANTEYKVRVRAFIGVSQGPWTAPPVPGPFLSVRRLKYDALGRVHEEHFPSRGTIRYTYDNLGDIVSVVAERTNSEAAPERP